MQVPMNQRSHSAAPTDSPSLHGRARSKSPHRSLSPPDYRYFLTLDERNVAQNALACFHLLNFRKEKKIGSSFARSTRLVITTLVKFLSTIELILNCHGNSSLSLSIADHRMPTHRTQIHGTSFVDDTEAFTAWPRIQSIPAFRIQSFWEIIVIYVVWIEGKKKKTIYFRGWIKYFHNILLPINSSQVWYFRTLRRDTNRLTLTMWGDNLICPFAFLALKSLVSTVDRS